MKVAIISTFDTFFDRVDLLKEYYQEKGLEVTVITSDYSHRLKESIKTIKQISSFLFDHITKIYLSTV